MPAGEVGANLAVRVTGSRSGYASTSRTTETTAAVLPGTIVTRTPKVTGGRRSGHTLKVSAGDWGPGTVKISYQWYRGSAKISGGTRSSYRLTSKDKGKKVTVLVRGTKAGYATVTKRVTVTIAK